MEVVIQNLLSIEGIRKQGGWMQANEHANISGEKVNIAYSFRTS